MTLNDLLTTTNINNQVHIYIENKTKDDLVLIFKGEAEDAIKYFNGCDKMMESKVEFINLTTDHETKAPFISIVIA